jgi:hypothetical protein
LFYVLFVLCRSVYRLCVNVYWLLPPGGYPTAVNKIYHIISYHIIYAWSLDVLRFRTVKVKEDQLSVYWIQKHTNIVTCVHVTHPDINFEFFLLRALQKFRNTKYEIQLKMLYSSPAPCVHTVQLPSSYCLHLRTLYFAFRRSSLEGRAGTLWDSSEHRILCFSFPQRTEYLSLVPHTPFILL